MILHYIEENHGAFYFGLARLHVYVSTCFLVYLHTCPPPLRISFPAFTDGLENILCCDGKFEASDVKRRFIRLLHRRNGVNDKDLTIGRFKLNLPLAQNFLEQGRKLFLNLRNRVNHTIASIT